MSFVLYQNRCNNLFSKPGAVHESPQRKRPTIAPKLYGNLLLQSKPPDRGTARVTIRHLKSSSPRLPREIICQSQ
jgi:hypothetical protein